MKIKNKILTILMSLAMVSVLIPWAAYTYKTEAAPDYTPAICLVTNGEAANITGGNGYPYHKFQTRYYNR